MPGINFMCALNKDLESKRKASQQVLETLLYEEDHFSEVLLDDQAYILSCVKYEKYPVTCFENDEFFICLEGKIYSEGKNCLKDELTRLAQELFSDRKDIKEFLADWLLDTDGDFVIFFLHKPTRRVVIINDVFSRLTLYCYQKDNYIIISRDYHFVSTLIDEKNFDKIAIAQYLLFGFCLDSRTYLEGVGRVAPSTLIRIDPEKHSFQKDVVHIFNFEIKKNKGKSVKQNARALVPLYVEACGKRANFDTPVILSLSGGMDSRTVCAALLKAGVKFKAVSQLGFNNNNLLDVSTAKQLADVLGVEWKKYQLEHGLGEKALEILKFKSGHFYLNRPQFLSYIKALEKDFGSGTVFFSGNGGDRLFNDIRPNIKVKSIDDLIKFILRGGPNATGFSVKDVSELTGLDEDEIMEELRRHFGAYPEKSMSQKNVHFNIYGQSFNLHHLGDDLKKNFMWSVTPYWSIQVFKHLMNCPDGQKKNRYLYTNFLSMLCPEAIEVPYADNLAKEGIVISKDKSCFWQLIRTIRKWPNPVRFIIKKMKKIIAKPNENIAKYNHSPDLISCLREQLFDGSEVTKVLSKTALDDIFRKKEDCSNHAMGCLFTITSAIEYISSGRSSIENYKESEMETHAWLPKKQ